jgi:hypothetical protein
MDKPVPKFPPINPPVSRQDLTRMNPIFGQPPLKNIGDIPPSTKPTPKFPDLPHHPPLGTDIPRMNPIFGMPPIKSWKPTPKFPKTPTHYFPHKKLKKRFRY